MQDKAASAVADGAGGTCFIILDTGQTESFNVCK